MEEKGSEESRAMSSFPAGTIIIISLSIWVVFLVVARVIRSMIWMSIGVFGLLFSFAIACYFWKEYADLKIEDYSKRKNFYRIFAFPLIIFGLLLPLLLAPGKDCEHATGLWLVGGGIISIGFGWLLGTFRKDIRGIP